MGRMEKVNEQVRREISLILQQEMSDQRFLFVTITKADVSPDLRNAKVYFTFLGDVQQAGQAKEMLKKASGLIRRYLGARITLRFTPELNFVLDRSMEMGRIIDKAIEERTRNEQNSEND